MSGSYYSLNAKYNTLLALINGLSPAGYPPAVDVMTTNTAQTVTAIKTFSVLPQSAVVPLVGDDFVNKTYADGLASTPTLSTVLTAGNNAGSSSIDMNNNDILLVNNIDLVTINGSAYPPVVAVDTLSAVLTAGNSASNNIILNNTTSDRIITLQPSAGSITIKDSNAVATELTIGLTTPYIAGVKTANIINDVGNSNEYAEIFIQAKNDVATQSSISIKSANSVFPSPTANPEIRLFVDNVNDGENALIDIFQDRFDFTLLGINKLIIAPLISTFNHFLTFNNTFGMIEQSIINTQTTASTNVTFNSAFVCRTIINTPTASGRRFILANPASEQQGAWFGFCNKSTAFTIAIEFPASTVIATIPVSPAGGIGSTARFASVGSTYFRAR